MKSLLTYDATNMVGLSTAPLGARLAKAKQTVLELNDSGQQGWLNLPHDREMVSRVMDMAKRQAEWKHCLVIGIGGSDLGTRAAYHALRRPGQGMELHFAGANTDPDELHDILSGLDIQQTLVNVISKSGDTIEPMATFFVVRERLIKTVGKKEHVAHIVATTGRRGTLRALAEHEGYETLPVPENVGGRFSVLSDVGLFPLACAGIDIRKLLRGAAGDFWDAAGKHAALNYLAASKKEQKIQVLMPYAARLKEFGCWYRQLWAESLGKEGGGPTPVAALGATDQHSQLQLYQDGPNDKTVTFIEVERFEHAFRVPSWKLSLHDILHAERAGTAQALTDARRPNGTIFIPAITPEAMGALFSFFELSVAISGELYGIDTYNQPGVEASKRITRKLLKL